MAPISSFGTGLLGMSFNDCEAVSEALDLLWKTGTTHVDTAPRYPPLNQGLAERLLGDAGVVAKGFLLDSKVAATDTNAKLTGEFIEETIRHTLKDLRLEKLNTLYIHEFDKVTPLPEQVAALNQYYEKGLFTKLGVVGFTVEQLEAFLTECSKTGPLKLSVYQGEHNIIIRGAEDKIFPILRQHGIAYYAHCPLAAGFLTGNFTNNRYENTRFADTHPLKAVFHGRYDKPELHEAVRKIEAEGAKHGISIRDAALRWLYHHSELTSTDAVITGATSLQQIQENADSVKAGNLPEGMVKLLNEIWQGLKEKRGYLL